MPSRRPWPPWLACALLALACLAVFSPALRGGFVWDDRVVVANDPRLRDLSHLREIWSGPFIPAGARTFGNAYYRPLTTTTFLFDRLSGGGRPGPFHATNLALHALAAGVAWLLLRRWLPGSWAPLAAALGFALHPSRVEPVAWISGRTDLLAGLLGLLAFWLFVVGWEDRRRAAAWLAPTVFALALLAKESAIVVAPLAGLYALLLSPAPTRAGRWREALWRSAPLLVPAAGALLLWWRLGLFAAPPPHRFDTPLAHLRYALHTLNLYDGLALWPARFEHVATALLPDGLRRHAPPAGALGAALTLAAAAPALGLWWTARRRPRLCFALAAWPLALLPALNILVLPAVVVLRLMYLPLFFLAAAAALAWQAAAERWGRTAPRPARAKRPAEPARLARPRPGLRRALATLPALPLLAFAALSFRECSVWRSDDTFWRAQLERAGDSANVQFMAGLNRREQGDPAGALDHLERAVRMAPDNPLYQLYLGDALLQTRQPARAAEVFGALLARDPGDGTPANRLGAALTELGRYEEARRRLQEAVDRSPGRADFHFDQGILLLRLADPAGAARSFENAVRADPRSASATSYLGLALAQLGDRSRGLSLAQRGLAMAPGDARLRAVLGQVQALANAPTAAPAGRAP